MTSVHHCGRRCSKMGFPGSAWAFSSDSCSSAHRRSLSIPNQHAVSKVSGLAARSPSSPRSPSRWSRLRERCWAQRPRTRVGEEKRVSHLAFSVTLMIDRGGGVRLARLCRHRPGRRPARRSRVGPSGEAASQQARTRAGLPWSDRPGGPHGHGRQRCRWHLDLLGGRSGLRLRNTVADPDHDAAARRRAGDGQPHGSGKRQGLRGADPGEVRPAGVPACNVAAPTLQSGDIHLRVRRYRSGNERGRHLEVHLGSHRRARRLAAGREGLVPQRGEDPPRRLGCVRRIHRGDGAVQPELGRGPHCDRRSRRSSPLRASSSS